MTPHALPPRDCAPPSGDFRRRFLAAIVFSLFGGMHVLAGLSFAQDRRTERAMLARLRSDTFGFEERRPPAGGATSRQGGASAWLWHVPQVAHDSEEDRAAGRSMGGPLVELARVIGTPAVRLRMALPEELYAGDLALSLGRKEGLASTSIAAMGLSEAQQRRAKLWHETVVPEAAADAPADKAGRRAAPPSAHGTAVPLSPVLRLAEELKHARETAAAEAAVRGQGDSSASRGGRTPSCRGGRLLADGGDSPSRGGAGEASLRPAAAGAAERAAPASLAVALDEGGGPAAAAQQPQQQEVQEGGSQRAAALRSITIKGGTSTPRLPPGGASSRNLALGDRKASRGAGGRPWGAASFSAPDGSPTAKGGAAVGSPLSLSARGPLSRDASTRGAGALLAASSPSAFLPARTPSVRPSGLLDEVGAGSPKKASFRVELHPGETEAQFLVSTALVTAFLFVARAVPTAELAARQRAAADVFARLTVRGHSFTRLVQMFKIMLGPGNIFSQARGSAGRGAVVAPPPPSRPSRPLAAPSRQPASGCVPSTSCGPVQPHRRRARPSRLAPLPRSLLPLRTSGWRAAGSGG